MLQQYNVLVTCASKLLCVELHESQQSATELSIRIVRSRILNHS